MRWAGRAAALVAVTGLGGIAVTGALGADADADQTVAIPSLSPTPGLTKSVATFPFEGGPEFEVASSAYACGDPAPTPQLQDHDLQLTLSSYADGTDGDAYFGASAPPLQALISPTTDAGVGVVGTSGVDVLVVKDGIVVGMIGGDGPDLDVSSSPHGGTSGNIAPVADWVRCPEDALRTERGSVEPGTYELIAVASAFSTPESVALSQVLDEGNVWNLVSHDQYDDYGAVYLPGSYDCKNAASMGAPTRPCLADFTPDVAVDTASRTVSLFYEASALVEEFSTVLVSEPITVELVSREAAGYGSTFDSGTLDGFGSLADLTCGASAFGTSLQTYTQDSVWLDVSLDQDRVDALVPGGAFGGTVMTVGVPDGSRIELLPGARLVYFSSTSVDVELDQGLSSSFQADVVTGWAPATLDAAVTTDRYTGPQAASFTVDAATLCPDVAGLGDGTIAVAGTWRITAPDGTVSTMDFSADAGYDQYGRKNTY